MNPKIPGPWLSSTNLSVVNNACGWGLRQAKVLMCGHSAEARGLATSSARVSSGIKGYLLIWSQWVSLPLLGFHLVPGVYLAEIESDSSMTVWSVPGFRISGFGCRWNPLRNQWGSPEWPNVKAGMNVIIQTPIMSILTSLSDSESNLQRCSWDILLNSYSNHDCGVSGIIHSNSNGVNE